MLGLQKKAKIKSCHAIIDGTPYIGELEPRISDLTQIPSPYLLGLMDKFFNCKLLPAIQTNRGCPFTCTFCTEGGKYYTKVFKTSFERKKAEVDYIVKKVKHTKTLRITDSNLGMFEEDVEFFEYLSDLQSRTGFPEFIVCSAGKNQQERILKCNELVNGAMRLTASVQSLDSKVLNNIKRKNITLDDIMSLSDRVSDTDTHSYSELILALPGDSLEAEKASFKGLMQAGISNITQHQLSLIYGTELASRQNIKEYQIKTMYRPVQRCVGRYRFENTPFTSIEIEAVAIANDTLSFEDYLECRRLYLTTGLFYNDRIFGEIHALLRLLNLNTWDWIEHLHNNICDFEEEIQMIYRDYIRETEDELWENRERLEKDIAKNINKYLSGEIGGNLIYKYRGKTIVEHFAKLHRIAFRYLRDILQKKDKYYDPLIDDMENYSFQQKSNLFDTNVKIFKDYDYDINSIIKNASLARKANPKDFHYPTKVRFTHNQNQKETIQRQIDFYGSSNSELAMILSRFPIKRFYRLAEVISS